MAELARSTLSENLVPPAGLPEGMENDLDLSQKYSKARDSIREAIEFLRPRVSQEKQELLDEILTKIRENRFNLVVLGQFKRGKTTFINALLGEPVLPSAIVPLTSIVTILEYGDKEKVEVFFEDGRVEEIPKEEIPKFVTERENPKNVKGVKYVRVLYPSEFLSSGIILIDTPGVGSLYENNTDVTYGFLPHVDAGIFLLTVDPPLSKEEIAFLKDILPNVEKLFFILNKIDYVGKNDLEEVLEFSKSNLVEALGEENIVLLPISAKMALDGRVAGDPEAVMESGITKVESELKEFLIKEKGKVIINSSANKVLNILGDLLFRIDLERKMATTPLETLEEKIKKFREIQEGILQERKDSEYLFKGEIDSLIRIVEEDVYRFRDKKIPQLCKALQETCAKEKHRGSIELSKVMDKALKETIVKEFDAMVEKENQRINEEYARIAKRFADRINGIINNLLSLSAELFEVSLEQFEVEESITDESGLYYVLEDRKMLIDFEGAAKFLSYAVLPHAIATKKIMNDVNKKIPEKLEMNCGRVRSDFVERITKSAMDLRWNMQQKLDQTISYVEEAIDRAMELKKKSKEEAEKALKELTSQRDLLNHYKETILKARSEYGAE